MLHFIKMQAYGNDFVIIDSRVSGSFVVNRDVARALSDRRYGVGCDQFVVLYEVAGTFPSADVEMHIFNADGEEVFMCGNALRCVIKLLSQKEGQSIAVRNRKGRVMQGFVENGHVTVNMGLPLFRGDDLPAWDDSSDMPSGLHVEGFEDPLCVSFGNPHAVYFGDSCVGDDFLQAYGPLIENHSAFPFKTNVEFVHQSEDGLVMRVWERGVGITPSCGSGASAVFSAAWKKGKVGDHGHVKTDGGVFSFVMRADGLWQTGEACEVFRGAYAVLPHACSSVRVVK